ncbi:MAG: hypothetical protein R3B51_09205 [Thermodesulfobacteriota bacterium]
MKEYFDAHGIAYVDVLDALSQRPRASSSTPQTGGHTNGNGYRIIAETINNYLERPNKHPLAVPDGFTECGPGSIILLLYG